MDAIETAKGKPGSPLKAVYIGTLSPSTGGWWHDLVKGGSHGSTFVMALQGDPEKWDSWPEIRRCNPLVEISPEFRIKLLSERDEARKDSRLKARFLSYRLNLPTADESHDAAETWMTGSVSWTVLLAYLPADPLSVLTWDMVGPGPVRWQYGIVDSSRRLLWRPVFRHWKNRKSATVFQKGTYRMLYQNGSLMVAEGLRVQPAAQLIDEVFRKWGRPTGISCDRFRVTDLQDCVRGVSLSTRMTRWSESGEDIRALRKIAGDGPLSVSPGSAALIGASLSAAMVKPDDSGNVRMVKRSTNNLARDDVASALVLGAGVFVRNAGRPRRPLRHALAG